MIAVDTNILVYAHRSENHLHAPAFGELKALAEGARPWALPVFCISEFIRVVTHRRVFSPASTIGEAMGFVRQLLAAPTCRLALPSEGFVDELEHALKAGNAKGNLVYDAQIAALCRQQGFDEILTNDLDFGRFPNLRVSRLSAGSA